MNLYNKTLSSFNLFLIINNKNIIEPVVKQYLSNIYGLKYIIYARNSYINEKNIFLAVFPVI
jgi:hypothetical protein